VIAAFYTLAIRLLTQHFFLQEWDSISNCLLVL